MGSEFGYFAIWVKTSKEYTKEEEEKGLDKLFYPIRIW
jgi:hypothetical protein